MMVSKVNRRKFLKMSGIGTGLLLGSSLDLNAQIADKIKVIQIRSNYRIGRWYFDPVGLHVQPGEKVRWVCTKWGGSATAYHPSNNNHELRIPENAETRVNQLREAGYKARTLGENKYGLHQVVYGSYTDRTEALKELRNIRNTDNPNAWMLIQELN